MNQDRRHPDEDDRPPDDAPIAASGLAEPTWLLDGKVRFFLGDGVRDSERSEAPMLFEDADLGFPQVRSFELGRAPATREQEAAMPAQPPPEQQLVEVEAASLIALELDSGLFFTTAARLLAMLQAGRGHPLLRWPNCIDLTPWAQAPASASASGKSEPAIPAIVKFHELGRPRLLTEAITDPAAVRGLAKGLEDLESDDGRRLLGLRRWTNPAAEPEPPDATLSTRRAQGNRPILVFVHDLGLDTLSSFGELLGSESEVWSVIEASYREGLAGSTSMEPAGVNVFSFEHASFGRSPIDNAVDLAQQLPEGATIDLVTLGRGGLIGDLLAGGRLKEQTAHFRRDVDGLGFWGSREQPDRPRPNVDPGCDSQGRPYDVPRTNLHRLVDTLTEAQASRLHQLSELRDRRRLTVRRYVRVASPARGTRLAAGCIDLFLSMLLEQAAHAQHRIGRQTASRLQRLVLDLIGARHDPHLVPGLEPLLPDSPLPRLLRNLSAQDGLKMAVIAGDHRSGTMLHRLATLAEDGIIDGLEHDQLVDTPSMLGGLARNAGARVLFAQGAHVEHLRQFSELDVRLAIRDWLVEDKPEQLDVFVTPPTQADADDSIAREMERLALRDFDEYGSRDIVVVVPSIMGSHLAVRAALPASRSEAIERVADGSTPGLDRIWFDPNDIALGAIRKLGLDAAGPEVVAEKLFGRYYADLIAHLARSYDVRPFPYDWRLSYRHSGEALCARLNDLLDQYPGITVRVLTHGTGVLVMRAALRLDPKLGDRLRERRGARLLMLGPPHHGAHSMVETLLGKADSIRSIARLDRDNGMQSVLSQIARFPGVLQVLPAPGFAEHYGEAEAIRRDYHDPQTWTELRDQASDLWFGEGRAAPLGACDCEAGGFDGPKALADAGAFWHWLGQAPDEPPIDGRSAAPCLDMPERFAESDFAVQVLGQAARTPCGLRLFPPRARGEPSALRVVGTARGDGTVTWASSAIRNVASTYYMPVEHGALAATREHFESLTDLLARGRTSGLPTVPASARDRRTEQPRCYDACPPLMDDSDTLARGLMGAMAPSGLKTRHQRKLQVRVRAGDLRFVQSPLLIGHYQNDPIAGPEHLLDQEMLGGALAARYALGAYAGAIGSATAVLRRPNAGESQPAALTGVIVSGLGPFGQPLQCAALTEAVRSGVLRFLLHATDVLGVDDAPLKLGALLVGYSSSANLGIEDSLEALVRGTLQANAKFAEATGRKMHVGELDIVELYLDTAIAAVYALRGLAPKLNEEARNQGSLLICRRALQHGEGARPRLIASGQSDYWSRLIVTTTNGAKPPSGAPTPFADRMRFVFVGPRARADAELQASQPGLLARMVAEGSRSSKRDRKLSRTLFQLLVPDGFKEIMRQSDRLIVIVDEGTANIPWEMLSEEEDGRADLQPLAIRTPLIRQLEAQDTRRRIRTSYPKRALVIGGPSTARSAEAFVDGTAQDPARLVHAQAEGRFVCERLQAMAYAADLLDESAEYCDVLKALLGGTYRIVHIAGHGVCNLRHRNHGLRTGVLLSDGFVLTATEIRAMETLPELVFLNCCHLGVVDSHGGSANLLAASLATELIQLGVRCVVAAGWETDDALARHFAGAFYRALLTENRTFGDAVHAARRACWDRDRDSATWGAFQAYGDAGWRLAPMAEGDSARVGGDRAAPDELLDELASLRVSASRRRPQLVAGNATRDRALRQLVARMPSAWREQAPVQSALGAAWIDLRKYEQAVAALRSAVRATDLLGRVPIRDVERLVLAQVHCATRREHEEQSDIDRAANQKKPPTSDHGVLGIRQALARLAQLGDLVGQGDSSTLTRGSIEAGALRRLAAVHAARVLRSAPGQERVAEFRRMQGAASRAARAYRELEQVQAQSEPNPLHTLNRLLMESARTLMRGRPTSSPRERGILQRCEAAAGREFTTEGALYQAVARPSIQVVRALIGGMLGRDDEQADRFVDVIVHAYEDATATVSATPAELGNVLEAFHLMARLYRAQALYLEGMDDRAEARDWLQRAAERLVTIAERLAPGCGIDTIQG